jgi:hypothetical protein
MPDRVFTYTSTGSDAGAAVGFDNEKAGRTAARYLLDLGHTRLGMIAEGFPTKHQSRPVTVRVAAPGAAEGQLSHGVSLIGALCTVQKQHSLPLTRQGAGCSLAC